MVGQRRFFCFSVRVVVVLGIWASETVVPSHWHLSQNPKGTVYRSQVTDT